MAITYQEASDRIYRIIKKSKTKPGQYTADRVADALQEAVDYVSGKQMLHGEGWTSRIRYIDTTAGQKEVNIPSRVVLINQVRYLVGGVYQPLIYDENREGHELEDTTQDPYPSRYRIVNNKLYFNPPIGTGQEKAIMIEATEYPSELDSAGNLPSTFMRAAEWFVCFRAATYLTQTSRNYSPPWASREAQWFEQMDTLIMRRNNQTTYIRDFMP